MNAVDHIIDPDGYEAITFTGVVHTLRAMPLEGVPGAVLVEILGPSGTAILTAEDSLELARYLERQASRAER